MGYLVVAFSVVWLALFGYLGWIVLRLRGAGAELASAREIVREREQENPGN